MSRYNEKRRALVGAAFFANVFRELSAVDGVEPISHSSDGLEKPGPLRIWLHRPPEPTHVDIQCPRVARVIRVPNLPDQMRPSEQTTRIVKEYLKQLGLLRREPRFSTQTPKLALGEVEQDGPDLQSVAFISRENPCNSIQELTRGEGRDQSQTRPISKVGPDAGGRKQDDRGSIQPRPKGSAHPASACLHRCGIEHDHIWFGAIEGLQGILDLMLGLYLISLLHQRRSKGRRASSTALDEHDGRRWHVGNLVRKNSAARSITAA